MTVIDCIAKMCNERNWSISKAAERADININTLHSAINRNNGMGMSAEKLVQIADALGYQVVIMSEDDEMILDGEWEEYLHDE